MHPKVYVRRSAEERDPFEDIVLDVGTVADQQKQRSEFRAPLREAAL